MSFTSNNFSELEFFYDNSTNFNRSLFDEATQKLATALNIYYTPLLILLGTLGNLVSIFVFYNSKLRLQSTSQYLTALAISDTVFLIQQLPPWLNAVQINGLFHTNGFCQVFVYVSYVTCCSSAWLVVAFTVERFVAVLYPLKRNVICTARRARYIIYSVVIAALLLNIPILRFATPTSDDCNIDKEYMQHAARFNLIDTGLAFTIPLAVIIVLNTWIMIGVYRLERARQTLVKAARSTASTGMTSGRLRATTRLPPPPRSQHRVTRMLLIVSSVFVLFNLPGYTMRIIAYACDIDEEEDRGRWAALQQVALMFFNTNFGINFILYCLSGQNFRRTLVQMMPCMRARARKTVTVRRTTSFRPAPGSSISTSFVSCTEAPSNYTTGQAGSTPNPLRRRREVINRWTFDNSRQRQQWIQQQQQQRPEEHEMDTFQPPPYG